MNEGLFAALAYWRLGTCDFANIPDMPMKGEENRVATQSKEIVTIPGKGGNSFHGYLLHHYKLLSIYTVPLGV